MRRVETPVEANAEGHLGLRERRAAGIDLRQVQIDRLLAKNCLARARCGLEDRRVRAWRRADDHRTNVRVGQGFGQAVGGARAVLLCERLARGDIEIDDPGEARSRMHSEGRGVHRTDEPRADQAEIDHLG